MLRSFPAQDSIAVDTLLEYIEIEFSEPVPEGTFKQSLFVSPPLQFEIEWQSAEVVRLLIRDTLWQEQTYVVTVGAGTTDEHGNKMKYSHSFAFSTGFKIDHGSISGTIYDLSNEQTASAFAYLLHDTTDIDPRKRQPLYVSQTGKSGAFHLNFLKEGRYRIFAVEDLNNNMLYDSRYERIGIPYRDIRIDSSRLAVNFVDFHLSKRDTVPPDLVGARAVNNRTINLRFSEPVVLPDSSFILLTDSLTGKSLTVLGWYKDEEEENNVWVFTQKMDSAAYYRIQPLILKDFNGNMNPNPGRRVIPASTRRDTTRFRLKELTPADSAQNIHPETSVRAEFSVAADWATVDSSFVLRLSTGDTVEGDWHPISALKAEFVPSAPLKTDSLYMAILKLGRVRDLWRTAAQDTTIRHSFTVISNRELGEIAGQVVWEGAQAAPVVLHIRKSGQEDLPITLHLNKPGKFYKEALLPGQYFLDAFVDLNNNGKYDYGGLEPFEPAEPFYFSADTVRVRKRWETGGVLLKIPTE